MKIVYSLTAQNDLRSIFQYISMHLNAPDAAKHIFEEITKSIRGLSELPERYPLCLDEPWNKLGMHKMVVLNYIVFYLVDNNSNRVSIARIVYGGRNLEDIMDEEISY